MACHPRSELYGLFLVALVLPVSSIFAAPESLPWQTPFKIQDFTRGEFTSFLSRSASTQFQPIGISDLRITRIAQGNASAVDEVFAQLTHEQPKVTIDGADYWLVETDVLKDQDELYQYAVQQVAERMRRSVTTGLMTLSVSTRPVGQISSLVAVASQGRIVRWRPDLQLSYCVLRRTFPSEGQYRDVVKHLEAATSAWERTCGVDFVHQQSLDETTGVPPKSVLFAARYIDADGTYIASAFFPTDPPHRRRVLIDPSFFQPSLPFDRTGVLRHELGHVLGFRHEHIRDTAPVDCPKESTEDTQDLTPYDSRSVMHYLCGNAGSPTLDITDSDRQGAQQVYGLPLSQLMFVSE